MSSGKQRKKAVKYSIRMSLTGNHRILPSTLVLVMMALEVIEWAKTT